MSTQTANLEIEQPAGPHGKVAIWCFLASEIVVFSGLLLSYVMVRLRYPDWSEFAANTMTSIGFTNTVVLLTSSLFVVLAHHYSMEKNSEKTAFYMGLAILCGFLFLGFKAFEYTHEFQKGITPVTNLFWSYYFFITGLHALHVIIGIVINIIIWKDARKGANFQRVEVAGLYWHFVDVVWIFVFPLFYVAN